MAEPLTGMDVKVAMIRAKVSGVEAARRLAKARGYAARSWKQVLWAVTADLVELSQADYARLISEICTKPEGGPHGA
jgi:hypothetical protein